MSQKTIDIEEARDKSKAHPMLAKVPKSSSAKKHTTVSIGYLLDYTAGLKPARTIRKMSRQESRAVLDVASKFSVNYNKGQAEFIFEEGAGDQLYSIARSGHGCKIKINKKSQVFETVGNPLFLIGLIVTEAKTIIENPSRYDDFLAMRNAAWSKFATDWTWTYMRTRPKKTSGSTLPNYSVSYELIDLHDHLKRRLGSSFQFTALGTLSSHLNNAYNKMVYTIQTMRGYGQPLYDHILDHFEEFVVLLDPKKSDVMTALDVSRRKRFIVIREYAPKISRTLAPPAKAWLDLYAEMKKNAIPISDEELTATLDYLLENELVTRAKMESAARHRNMLEDIKEYLET